VEKLTSRIKSFHVFLPVQKGGYNVLIKFAMQIWNFLLAGYVEKGLK